MLEEQGSEGGEDEVDEEGSQFDEEIQEVQIKSKRQRLDEESDGQADMDFLDDSVSDDLED